MVRMRWREEKGKMEKDKAASDETKADTAEGK